MEKETQKTTTVAFVLSSRKKRRTFRSKLIQIDFGRMQGTTSNTLLDLLWLEPVIGKPESENLLILLFECVNMILIWQKVEKNGYINLNSIQDEVTSFILDFLNF